MTRYLRSTTTALALALIVGACSSRAERVGDAAMAYEENIATAHVQHSVGAVADIAESVFRTMNIRLDEREEEADDPDEIEVEGTDGDAKVTVEVERHGDPEQTRVQVSVKRDTDYDLARAQQILNAILAAL